MKNASKLAYETHEKIFYAVTGVSMAMSVLHLAIDNIEMLQRNGAIPASIAEDITQSKNALILSANRISEEMTDINEVLQYLDSYRDKETTPNSRETITGLNP